MFIQNIPTILPDDLISGRNRHRPDRDGEDTYCEQCEESWPCERVLLIEIVRLLTVIRLGQH